MLTDMEQSNLNLNVYLIVYLFIYIIIYMNENQQGFARTVNYVNVEKTEIEH